MASRGINKHILVGNLGQDPEIRYSPNGSPVVSLSVATSECWTKNGKAQEVTDWHRVVVFGNLAINIDTKLALVKGETVYIEGKNTTRCWTDNNGVKRYITEIIVDDFNGVFLAIGRRPEQGVAAQQEQTPTLNQPMDDDIPF